MQRKMETPEAQEIYKLRSKTAELPCKHETKHALDRIHNNRIKTSKHRIQTICNRI